MKILLLAVDIDLSIPRGDAVHTSELARNLGALGNLVDLVTATPEGLRPSLGALVRHHTRPTGAGVEVIRFCSRVAKTSGVQVVYERRLSPKLSYSVSRACAVPFAVEINGTEAEPAILGREARSILDPIKGPIRGHFYRKASAIVTVSDGLARILRDKYRIRPDRIHIIPNGVDPILFHPMDRALARRKLGLTDGEWVVFVGNLVPWQGVGTLLRAVSLVRATAPSVRVVVVGDGPLRRKLEELSKELHLQSTVSFVGPVPHAEVPIYISASSVCVAPFTRMRNFEIGLSPLKVYEYLACGRPVIASDVPGVRDLLKGFDVGVVIRPDDPSALSEALVQVLSDSVAADAMGARGRELAEGKFTWSETARRIEGILGSIAIR